MGINFGGVLFSEPVLISTWSPLYRAGLYAILVFDITISPKPYRVIYFGESSNLSERGFLTSHHKYSCWVREAGSSGNLYISVYLMPNSTADQRRAIEQKLIAMYKPICNQD